LDGARLGSPSPPAPAVFRGAVAALAASAAGVGALAPFLEGAAEIMLDAPAFPAAFDNATPGPALEPKWDFKLDWDWEITCEDLEITCESAA